MGEILGEEWLLKNMMDILVVCWLFEFVKLLKEVDIEYDYFKRWDLCILDDIFGERKILRRKRSFGVILVVLIMMEEKLKFEVSVVCFEQEFEDYK